MEQIMFTLNNILQKVEDFIEAGNENPNPNQDSKEQERDTDLESNNSNVPTKPKFVTLQN